jgi:hypothetical protein
LIVAFLREHYNLSRFAGYDPSRNKKKDTL